MNMTKITMKGLRDCKRQTAMPARRTGIGGDLGQALVELALVTPLLVLLLVGAAEVGRLAYAAIEVTNAAHAGAQYGAQNHATASDIAGMETAALDDGPNVTSMTATATHTCGCANGAASTCLATDCAGSRMLEYVQVNTTARVDPVFFYPGLRRRFIFHGQAILRVEQ